MRTLAVLIALLLYVTLAFSQVDSSVQAQPGSDVSDLDGRAVVQASLAALGGENAISSVKTVRAEGKIALLDSDAKQDLLFIWDDDLSGPKLEFRDEVRDGANLRVFASGHGSPGFRVNGKNRKLFSHVSDAAPPFHLPALLLLRTSKGTAAKTTLVEQEVLDQTPVEHLRIDFSSADPNHSVKQQDWYVSRATGLPLRIDYRVPSTLDALSFEKASATFSDFRKVDGVLFPFHIDVSQNGKPASSVTIDSITTNPTLSSSSFDLLEGVQ